MVGREVVLPPCRAGRPARPCSPRCGAGSTSATAVHVGSNVVTREAKSRSASSTASTVLGTGRDGQLVQVGGHGGRHLGRPGAISVPGHLGRPASADGARDAAAASAFIGPPPQRLGLDGLGGAAVLVGQPVRPEVQIDPGRGDRAVSGLGLKGLEGHARLAQAGEAGVAQLVTGPVRETGPFPAAPRISSSPSAESGSAPALSFQRDEERIARRLRSLVVHIAATVLKKVGEIGTSRWWPPLPSATKTRHSPRRRSESRSPSTSQRRRPPSSIAWTMARSRSVRSSPTSASASSGSRILGSRRTPRTSGSPLPERPRVWRVAMPRGTGFADHRCRRG